ncbi:hypothetical protein IMG5_097500 [Ichthyophthirius multifiliis]|uniref:Palmitoyltransferase n=1 Tax=Ichthyophthirius multifiliis TaxID=5932 RepID=G0QRT9_ICHMU|nr:hypothetical protein IMG5_097500 [Ichthyophthirius multifiliis]EGR32073.1 hypothetical protein IMG5_097500 [Ichthyophthirius multifiliis]|eukprot:XP_004035559.1 hypothetical protein IMG5_097500 [Ichthyophthirius multifiliis]
MQQDGYCFKCNQIKPMRAHHCKDCQLCVSRMDHHCPWIANCVGINNHKFFFLFLFHAVQSVGTCFVSISIDYLFNDQMFYKNTENKKKILIISCWFMTFGLTLSIGYLFMTQISRLLQNITTVESHVPEIHQRVNQYAIFIIQRYLYKIIIRIIRFYFQIQGLIQNNFNKFNQIFISIQFIQKNQYVSYFIKFQFYYPLYIYFLIILINVLESFQKKYQFKYKRNNGIQQILLVLSML